MPTDATRKMKTFAYLGVALVSVAIGLAAYTRHLQNDASLTKPPTSTPTSQVNPGDVSGPTAVPPNLDMMPRSDGTAYEGQVMAGDEPITASHMDASLAGDGIKYDVQSPARPYGLDIVAPVQMAGSDEASADFMANTLPDILNYLESNAVQNISLELISTEANRSNLMLENPASVRIYFVGDAAHYHNSIGINFADDSGSMLVFPDASSRQSPDGGGNARQEYTSSDYPLLSGDFVDIGAADAGSVLDFFIISDGANEGTDAYSIDKTLNEDLLSHARILGMVGDSVIVLGFEDMKNGGDHDYNDVIIAVDVGQENLGALSANLGL